MEKSDLGSKKINNEQQVNEGFSGKNIDENYNPSTPGLKTEMEKDAQGNLIHVERARYVDKEMENSNSAPQVDYPTKSINQTPEKAEHKDFNSNPNPEEFPDKEKKNQENRGNIEE